MQINELLEFTKEKGASDLHLSAGAIPVVRIDGKLIKLNLPEMNSKEIEGMVFAILGEYHRKAFDETNEVDFAYELDSESRFRVNLFRQLRGISAAFRLIPTEIKGFEDLGLPEILKKFSLMEKGLVLITGPTGCGKSTTLAAMVDHINENRSRHIITIEDPIEFIHQNKNSLVNQRELGTHTHSFQNALRVAMREDPDVILVGEMRDLETISLALTAAETGHLVFSTIHTSGAAKTIDRVIDIFPAGAKDQIRTMLSESLAAVVSQRLLPAKQGNGRIVALEVLTATNAVRNLIREDKIYQLPSVIQSGGEHGMISLDMFLVNLIREGKVSRDEAARVAQDPSKIS